MRYWQNVLVWLDSIVRNTDAKFIDSSIDCIFLLNMNIQNLCEIDVTNLLLQIVDIVVDVK